MEKNWGDTPSATLKITFPCAYHFGPCISTEGNLVHV